VRNDSGRQRALSIIILVVVGSLIALALVSPGAAPFIYTLF
jgi:hypothetical protein